MFRRIAISAVTIALAVYAGLLLLLLVGQERLIFLPQPEPVGPVLAPPGWTISQQDFRSHDGLTLRGLIVLPPEPARALVVYYGGNAQEISYLAGSANRFGGAALLLVNYRGYGGNPGAPGEAALIADGVAVLKQAQAALSIPNSGVILYGRSLGTGVAVGVAAQLASEAPLGGLILTTPFDSVRAVAAANYPFFPTAWLLRHPFDSASRAETLTAPVLILLAGADQVIPPAHGRALHARWRGAKSQVEYSGRSHDDVAGAPGYWDTIAAFIRDHAKTSAPGAPAAQR